MERKNRVLVTGGAGCVGSYVVDELLKLGYSVRAVDLPDSKFLVKNREGLEIMEGSITDIDFLKKAILNIDYVINTAAIVDLSLPLSKLKPVNTDAVISLWNLAKENGVRSFVHFSTGAVYKFSDKMLTEDMPVHRVNNYVESKILTDDFLKEEAEKGDGPIISILRPALIFGPKGKVLAAQYAMLPPMLYLISNRTIGLKGGPKSNYIHSLDVARAAIHLMINNKKSGEIFNIANDDPLSVSDVFNTVNEAYGLKLIKPFIPFPGKLIKRFEKFISNPRVLNSFNRFMDLMWKRIVEKNNLRYELKPKFDAEFLAYAIYDVVFDNTKIKNMGFKLEFPKFKSGWINTLEWYQSNNWCPKITYQLKEPIVGFKFKETMSGSLNVKGKERNVSFTLTATARSIRHFLKDYMTEAEGNISIDGIAENAPCKGSIEIAILPPKKQLNYELKWKGKDNNEYILKGTKYIKYTRFLTTMTTLYSSLYRENKEIGEGIIYFKKKDIPGFLLTFKPVL